MPTSTTPSPESTHPYRAAAPRLGEPPRHVPLSTKIPLALGGTMALIGWAFFVIGSVLCWAFLPRLDLRRLVENGPHDTAEAEVTSTRDAHIEINDHSIYRVEYTLTVDGRAYFGRSYADEAPPDVGSTHTVEFPKGHPEDSRMLGMTRQPVPAWGGFVFLFPLLGGGLIVFGTRAGRRAIGLLRDGRLARARIAETHKTTSSINERPVYLLRLRFEADDGREHDIEMRTHEPERLGGDGTPVLYLPADPQQATALEHLPGPPRLSAAGAILGRPGLATGYVLLAVGAVAANALAAWLALV